MWAQLCCLKNTYLTRLECLPHKFLKLIIGNFATELLLQLSQPNEHLLVGQTVQWASQTIHASSKRKIRIRES